MRSLTIACKHASPVITITVSLLTFRPLIALFERKKKKEKRCEHHLDKNVRLGYVFKLPTISRKTMALHSSKCVGDLSQLSRCPGGKKGHILLSSFINEMNKRIVFGDSELVVENQISKKSTSELKVITGFPPHHSSSYLTP